MKAETYRDKLTDLQLEVEELRAKLKEAQTGDLISRQAALDALTSTAGVGNRALDKIRSLPSAQPEITMEDVKEYCRKRCLTVITNELFRQMRANWSQPEIVRCKDCKYSDENWRRVSVKWLPCMDVRTGSNWFCGSAERREE